MNLYFTVPDALRGIPTGKVNANLSGEANARALRKIAESSAVCSRIGCTVAAEVAG